MVVSVWTDVMTRAMTYGMRSTCAVCQRQQHGETCRKDVRAHNLAFLRIPVIAYKCAVKLSELEVCSVFVVIRTADVTASRG